MARFYGAGDFQMTANRGLIENMEHGGPGVWEISANDVTIDRVVGDVTVIGERVRLSNVDGDVTVLGGYADISNVHGNVDLQAGNSFVRGVYGTITGTGCTQANIEVTGGDPINPPTNLVYLYAASHVALKVNGEYIDQHGVILENCSYVAVEGVLDNCGRAADNTYDCVHLISSPEIHLGDLILRPGSSNAARSGVSIDANSDFCVLGDVNTGANSGWGTAAVIDNASGTLGTPWAW